MYHATPSEAGRAGDSPDSETPTNLGPLSAEGMTEARLTAAIPSQMMRIGPTKRAIFVEPELILSPANIAWRVSRGIFVAIIAKALEPLSRAPVVPRVADIQDAT